MIVWVDANLPPALAPWMTQELGVEAVSAEYLGLLAAADAEIFERARQSGVVILTKDLDFVELIHRHGPPPQVVWLSCGNTSNIRLRSILIAE
ncbi:MAG: DUF5615 family PIN-like protein [Planctomycetaceae bacterium]